MYRYLFKVRLIGKGNTPEEAWRDAVEAFAAAPGPWPSDAQPEPPDDEDE